MKHSLFSVKGSSIKPLFVFFIAAMIVTSCNDCPECPPATTPTPAAAAQAPVTANFHHLKMDKSVLVGYFMNLSNSDFKKMILPYGVTDYNHFPDSLTMAAYPAKNNDDITNDQPKMLGILPDAESLPTDVIFSTQEISRTKLARLVGPTGNEVTYDYIVFIPNIKDSIGKKFLRYRVEIRPVPGGGSGDSENTNPCPPYKPND